MAPSVLPLRSQNGAVASARVGRMMPLSMQEKGSAVMDRAQVREQSASEQRWIGDQGNFRAADLGGMRLFAGDQVLLAVPC